MYICICHAIRENEVKEIIHSENIKDIQGLKKTCKAGSDCGSCLGKLREMLSNQQQSSHDSTKKRL